MASPFDNPEWWRKVNATQQAINNMLEPSRKIQELAAKLPDQQIAKINEQLFGSQRRMVELLRRNVEAIEGPRRAMQQHYLQLNRWLKDYDFLANYRKVAEAGRQFVDRWYQALPVNWRELESEPILRLIKLTRDEGLPLVWVPGPELTAEISEKEERAEALALLTSESDRVLEDVEAVLDEVSSEELTSWADKIRKAVAASRDGHAETAQATAGVVVTAALEKGMRFKRLKKVRSAAKRFDPDRVRLAHYRTTLVIQLGSRSVQGEGYQLPGFNRGDTIRAVDEQYTPENSLTGIMLATTLLRECQELRDEGLLTNETGSNGGDPNA